MQSTRRELLLQGLFGTGLVGLRALATGLPLAFLLDPRVAAAQTTPDAQFLILSTSGAGDPLNTNAPGTYDGAAAVAFTHPKTAELTPTPVMVGGRAVTAAAPWATLSADTLARTAFIHHATLTANHGEQGRVMELMGAVRRGVMSTSLFAHELSQSLSTVQPQPIALGNEVTQFDGQNQPLFTPMGIKSVLTGSQSPLSKLQAIRDADLNSLYKAYKDNRGTRAQRAFIDNLAQSQTDLRDLSTKLADGLNAINDNGQDSQVRMAVLLARMAVAPIFTVHIDFGGDNHTDNGWQSETAKTVQGLKTINLLMDTLKQNSLQDKVTFASLNVFGRELTVPGEGRGHNATHHVLLGIGKNFRSCVIGGVSAAGAALDLDPSTGVGAAGAPVAMIDSLGAAGKTLGAAVGVSDAVLNDQITAGQVITAALA